MQYFTTQIALFTNITITKYKSELGCLYFCPPGYMINFL